MSDATTPAGTLRSYVARQPIHGRDLKVWGYELFPGFFFSKPVIVSTREIPAVRLNLLRVLEPLHRAELSLEPLPLDDDVRRAPLGRPGGLAGPRRAGLDRLLR